MRKAFIYIIAIINIALTIKYGYGNVDFVLMALTTCFSFIFFNGMKNIKDNVLVLYFMFYIILSIHVVALFELSSTGFFKDVIYLNEYRALAIWGNRLLFVFFVTLIVCSRIKFKTIKERQFRRLKGGIDKPFIVFTFVVYLFAIISVYLGSSDLMGEVKVVLPFHLNGLIDEVRANVYPFVFTIYVYDCLIKKRPIKKNIIVLYLIYVVAEIIIKSSKGAFLYSFLPVLTLLAFMGYYSKKTIARFVLPVFLVFLVLYPIIETARSEGSVSLDSIKTASQTERANQGDEHSSPYIRAFLTGVYYTKMVDIISDDQFSFDFRRVPLLISMDYGGVSYMTNVLDGVPEGSKQSSGVTGLCDALLWGGYPLCYIVLVLLVLLCYWGDHKGFMRSTPLYKVILFWIIHRLMVGRTISSFSDTFMFAMLGSSAIKYIVTKFYYHKYY